MHSEPQNGVVQLALENSEPHEHGVRGEAQPLLEKIYFFLLKCQARIALQNAPKSNVNYLVKF